MKKYITPAVDVQNIATANVLLTSIGFSNEGVDGSKALSRKNQMNDFELDEE